MADNKLLGAGGLYYGGNEISKAYMGNNLVWEKGPDYDPNYMLKCFNGSGYYSSGTGPSFTITNSDNYKIQIGVKDTLDFAQYAKTNYVLSPGLSGVLNIGYDFVYIGGNNIQRYISNTWKYLEFEINKGTTNNAKCLTTGDTWSFTPISLSSVGLIPSVSGGYVGRCYCSYNYLKIWSNDVLLHDVHAKKFSDGTRGFIDIVTGLTYTKENGGISSSVTLTDDSL